MRSCKADSSMLPASSNSHTGLNIVSCDIAVVRIVYIDSIAWLACVENRIVVDIGIIELVYVYARTLKGIACIAVYVEAIDLGIIWACAAASCKTYYAIIKTGVAVVACHSQRNCEDESLVFKGSGKLDYVSCLVYWSLCFSIWAEVGVVVLFIYYKLACTQHIWTAAWQYIRAWTGQYIRAWTGQDIWIWTLTIGIAAFLIMTGNNSWLWIQIGKLHFSKRCGSWILIIRWGYWILIGNKIWTSISTIQVKIRCIIIRRII